MSLKGSCLCGAVRYEASAEPVFAGHCYCSDCQKESGCGHVTIAAVLDAAVKTTGKTMTFGKPGSSGQIIERTFCSICGTTVFSRPQAMPGMTMLRAGTLDNPSQVKPAKSIYVSRAQLWDQPHSSIPAFPEMPPRA
jgi:hypothetical protein